MPRGQGRTDIMAWIASQRPGTEVSIDTLTARWPEVQRDTAASMLRRACRNGDLEPTTRIAHYSAARTKAAVPPPSEPLPIGTLLEVVGQAASGLPMVRDEAGVVYIATPVKG
jgi:hypothetical protein